MNIDSDNSPALGPLHGIKVVDLTAAVLGPVATQVLGDMGADVVKVEPQAGDPMRKIGPGRHPDMSAIYLAFNRNKRSVALDLKDRTAYQALLKLCEQADVFVHNMRPSAAARLGLDYASLREVNPLIIHASASGYRLDSKWRDRPAFDDVIQGESGFAGLIERANGEARYVPMPICDQVVGQILAGHIAMALFQRERSGQGQELHLPMLETMLSMTLGVHMDHGILAQPEKGLGYPRMFTPHRRPYRTKDGYICILAVYDEQWQRLLGAIGRPELAEDPRFKLLADRANNLGELLAQVGESLLEKTTAQWREILDAADVPNGSMNTLEDIWQDEYLRDTGFFVEYEHPSEGQLTTTAIPAVFSATPGGLHKPPPNLGEHTEQVLRAAGVDESTISTLVARQK